LSATTVVGEPVPSWLLAALAPLGAALLSYIVAVRKLSGSIDTTTADRLWVEAKAIREDYRADIAEKERRIVSLEKRVAEVERDNTRLMRENLQHGGTISNYEARISVYEDQFAELTRRLAACESELETQKGAL
jgi:chromosome segregation ATPase